MAAATVSKVVWIFILFLGMLNTMAYIFSLGGIQAQAFPLPSKFKPVKYRFANVETGDLLAVDKNGTIHGKGDHREDHVCFYYHHPKKGIVMLESVSGLGYVSVDIEGNVTMATENFSDEEPDEMDSPHQGQDEMGSAQQEQNQTSSGSFVWYRRFKALYDSATTYGSSHQEVRLESEELPGCYLSFDESGAPLNACAHEGEEVTKFTLLRAGC